MQCYYKFFNETDLRELDNVYCSCMCTVGPKVMHIGRKNIERPCKLASVEGILDLSEVDNACDLGKKFQSNLQFDKHVANICAKANRTVGIIKHKYRHVPNFV